MRTIAILIGTTALIGLAVPSSAAEKTASAYAGQQARSIKALSDEDIASLRGGEGRGMAKAAELNGYPGPRHVLALARELRLTDAQDGQVAALHERMSASARPLGTELIERERVLDELFAKGDITPERLIAEQQRSARFRDDCVPSILRPTWRPAQF